MFNLSEKNEIEIKKRFKPRKVKRRKKDKVFHLTCSICKKKLEIICKDGEHLIVGELTVKEKAFELCMGFTTCPICKKIVLLKHREDNLHSI